MVGCCRRRGRKEAAVPVYEAALQEQWAEALDTAEEGRVEADQVQAASSSSQRVAQAADERSVHFADEDQQVQFRPSDDDPEDEGAEEEEEEEDEDEDAAECEEEEEQLTGTEDVFVVNISPPRCCDALVDEISPSRLAPAATAVLLRGMGSDSCSAPASPDEEFAPGAGERSDEEEHRERARGAAEAATSLMAAVAVVAAASHERDREAGGDAAASRTPTPSRDAGAVGPGDTVVAKGLTSAVHLNDQHGICECWDAPKGRWLVRMRDNSLVSLRPECLVKVKPVGVLDAPDLADSRENLGDGKDVSLDCQEAQELHVGSAVSVGGLLNATHLNGQCGVCESWDEIRCRWMVRLDNCEAPVKALKPENLVLQDLRRLAPAGLPAVRREAAPAKAPSRVGTLGVAAVTAVDVQQEDLEDDVSDIHAEEVAAAADAGFEGPCFLGPALIAADEPPAPPSGAEPAASPAEAEAAAVPPHGGARGVHFAGGAELVCEFVEDAPCFPEAHDTKKHDVFEGVVGDAAVDATADLVAASASLTDAWCGDARADADASPASCDATDSEDEWLPTFSVHSPDKDVRKETADDSEVDSVDEAPRAASPAAFPPDDTSDAPTPVVSNVELHWNRFVSAALLRKEPPDDAPLPVLSTAELHWDRLVSAALLRKKQPVVDDAAGDEAEDEVVYMIKDVTLLQDDAEPDIGKLRVAEKDDAEFDGGALRVAASAEPPSFEPPPRGTLAEFAAGHPILCKSPAVGAPPELVEAPEEHTKEHGKECIVAGAELTQQDHAGPPLPPPPDDEGDVIGITDAGELAEMPRPALDCTLAEGSPQHTPATGNLWPWSPKAVATPPVQIRADLAEASPPRADIATAAGVEKQDPEVASLCSRDEAPGLAAAAAAGSWGAAAAEDRRGDASPRGSESRLQLEPPSVASLPRADAATAAGAEQQKPEVTAQCSADDVPAPVAAPAASLWIAGAVEDRRGDASPRGSEARLRPEPLAAEPSGKGDIAAAPHAAGGERKPIDELDELDDLFANLDALGPPPLLGDGPPASLRPGPPGTPTWLPPDLLLAEGRPEPFEDSQDDFADADLPMLMEDQVFGEKMEAAEPETEADSAVLSAEAGGVRQPSAPGAEATAGLPADELPLTEAPAPSQAASLESERVAAGAPPSELAARSGSSLPPLPRPPETQASDWQPVETSSIELSPGAVTTTTDASPSVISFGSPQGRCAVPAQLNLQAVEEGAPSETPLGDEQIMEMAFEVAGRHTRTVSFDISSALDEGGAVSGGDEDDLSDREFASPASCPCDDVEEGFVEALPTTVSVEAGRTASMQSTRSQVERRWLQEVFACSRDAEGPAAENALEAADRQPPEGDEEMMTRLETFDLR